MASISFPIPSRIQDLAPNASFSVRCNPQSIARAETTSPLDRDDGVKKVLLRRLWKFTEDSIADRKGCALRMRGTPARSDPDDPERRRFFLKNV
jgi:hypothetical protein